LTNQKKQHDIKHKYIKLIKNTLISTTLIGAITLSDILISVTSVSANEDRLTTVLNKVKFNDYQSDQYWSHDMLWAIDNGLIQGYMNSTHPSNKNNNLVGNWIDPQGGLLESQMLTVLFRYVKNDELIKTVPIDTKWWASSVYQLALKYSVPTEGSLRNRAATSTIMTRGNLSQALATLHFGRLVSMQTAVQFMYDADLSTGLPDKSGKYLKTYNSYGVDTPLKRAHIVSFIKRYDDFKKSGKKVVETTLLQTVKGVKVQFGNHTYGSKSQIEYNKVMEVINKGMANYKDIKYDNGGPLEPYYQRYLDGDRSPNYDRDSLEYMGLKTAEYKIGALIKNGVSHSVAKDAYQATVATLSLFENTRDAKTKEGWANSSAYDMLFNQIRDDKSVAQILSAGYDKAGYVTAIVHKATGGYVDGRLISTVSGPSFLIRIEANWYMMQLQSGSFFYVSESDLKGFYVTTKPTDGSGVYSLLKLYNLGY